MGTTISDQRERTAKAVRCRGITAETKGEIMFSLERMGEYAETNEVVQIRHTFANGYGVSIVRNEYSYGGREGFFELAVIGRDGLINYDTSVTDDVAGWLTVDDVVDLMHRVENL